MPIYCMRLCQPKITSPEKMMNIQNKSFSEEGKCKSSKELELVNEFRKVYMCYTLVTPNQNLIFFFLLI